MRISAGETHFEAKVVKQKKTFTKQDFADIESHSFMSKGFIGPKLNLNL